MSSPGWYRRRSAVFALIYLAGFVGGWAARLPRPYEPAFASLGARLGAAGSPALLGLAVVFTAACLAIRMWGSSYLSAALVWNADARTDSLVIAGPFRYTRNPLYLGNVLLALGFGLLAPVPGFIFIVIANVAFVAALIRYEERLMLQRYGEAFQNYCAQVPRLFPRLIPAPKNAGISPSLMQGVLSELFTSAIAAGLFAWVLLPGYGVYVFIALYFAGVFVQRAIERTQQTHS